MLVQQLRPQRLSYLISFKELRNRQGRQSSSGVKMKSASFNNLPDDLILDVIGQLNTARDISALATSSQRTYSLVHQDGWRSFVRQGFPRVNLPPGGGSDWRSLAGRLTYLDRCWERRAFLIHDFQEVKGRGRRFNAPLGGQSVSFYPALDARLVSSEDRELATWGAGEDLITRLGGTGGDKHAKWHRLEGSKSGYRGGFGDVTAVSIIDRGPRPEILVGRANGDMKLMEATGDDMGTVTQNLHPTLALKNGGGASTPRKSPGQIAVSWTEWDPLSNMVASGRHSSIMLHDLNKAEEQDLSPVAYYDFLEDGPIDEPSLVRGIKFLNDDTIACSLGGSRRPLRWGKITPTGVEFFDAADNYTPLEYLASQTEISWDEKTTVRAIEKVGHGSSESLLLSAWDDGTYRYDPPAPPLSSPFFYSRESVLTGVKAARYPYPITVRRRVPRPVEPLRRGKLPARLWYAALRGRGQHGAQHPALRLPLPQTVPPQ